MENLSDSVVETNNFFRERLPEEAAKEARPSILAALSSFGHNNVVSYNNNV